MTDEPAHKVSLVEASYHGEYRTVCDLVSQLPPSSLDMTATVDKIGSSGGDLHNCTALTVATIQGHSDIAKVLLEAGASHSIRDCTGSTAFSEAVYHNHIELVVLLHRFEADVNAANSFGWTPLHVATFQGNLEIASKLLDLGADVDKVTPEGYTPLHLATMSGKTAIVAYLLSKGISPCFVEYIPTHESPVPCPLFLAVAGHFKGLVSKYLKHPACPLSSRVDALLLTGAVDVLDSRMKQAKSNWFKALQLRENHNIPFNSSPCDGFNSRCKLDLIKLSELFERDDSEVEAAYQTVIIWERCMGTVDQRYWQCLKHLTEKLVNAERTEEAKEVIVRGLSMVESSQLPLLKKGCLLPQNFEVFFGDVLQQMVIPHLASQTVSFEATFPYVLKALDVIIARGAHLFNTFRCPNFVPKYLFGIVLQMFELWLRLDVTLSEYESREQFGRRFVSKYLYQSDGSNLLFILLQSPCQNQTKLCEALLTWGASDAINSIYNGRRLFQKVVNVESALQKQNIVSSPFLKLLVSHGVHSDAVDSSGKSAIDCCPELFTPSCPLPLACLAAKTIIKDSLPYQNMLDVAPRLKKFIMLHDLQQF